MTPFRVLTLNSISPAGLDQLPRGLYQVGNEFAEPDAVLVRSHKMHDMAIPASVRAIARAGAGTNNIPVPILSSRGVPVFNAPGANANAVTELVFAALLIAVRNLVPALSFVAGLPEADDAALGRMVEDGKKRFVGSELPGRTLGIVGLGAIGSMVADMALAHGMSVLGYDPEITVDAAWRLSSEVRKAHSVEEVLENSDVVTLHVPLVEGTRNLIDEARVARMRPNCILLNFAREGLVDEDAILSGLAAGRIRSYVCDFPTQRLRGHPGVIAFPHLGASTLEAEDNCARMVVAQLRDYLEHGNIRNAVNFPNVDMRRESPHRVAIANSNVPNMLGQISTAMAQANLNIHNMINKSRGEMAYTLVDVDSPVPGALVAALSGIKGVLSVRAIPLQPDSPR